jgi:hypothetical protein
MLAKFCETEFDKVTVVTAEASDGQLLSAQAQTPFLQ